jgi:endonuclease/exonuclease/phosphatase family metal-dependent hydrolase
MQGRSAVWLAIIFCVVIAGSALGATPESKLNSLELQSPESNHAVPFPRSLEPVPVATQLRVLSWNIQFAQGTDGITNVDRTTTWIARFNPDLIGLCEVPSGIVPTLVSLLQQKTGRVWFSHFVPKFSTTDEGNLILSRFPFSATDGLFLTANRSVAHVTVNVDGTNVQFFATHLDDASSSNRVVEAGELKSWASNFPGPRIFTGDFNAGPDTTETMSLLDSYMDSWNEARAISTAVAYPDNPVGLHTRTRRGRID